MFSEKGGAMSKDAAQAFVEKMKNDEALRAKVMAEEDVEARMALIAGEGFDRSATEIGALQELSEAELDAVTGGDWADDFTRSQCTSGFVCSHPYYP